MTFRSKEVIMATVTVIMEKMINKIIGRGSGRKNRACVDRFAKLPFYNKTKLCHH